ncbi:Uncharacterised protein [uncultured archaeon]|nr:Uncharacterised protein [uncultured archaeon]
MRKAILDTSSIIFACSYMKDIFEIAEDQLEAKVVVSKGVIRELRGIASGRTKEGKASRIALEFMKRHDIEVVEDNGEVDEWILRAGRSEGTYVCTNDIKLKEALKRKGKRALSVSESEVLR